MAELIKSKLGYKYHWTVADYLQRAARHIASAIDVEQAYALAGKTVVMPTIVRTSDKPYRGKIGEAKLSRTASALRLPPGVTWRR